MGRTCGTNGGEEERMYAISGKARTNKQLGRPRRKWVHVDDNNDDNNSNNNNNNNMDLTDIGYSEMDWINLAQERIPRRALVNTEKNLRVSLKIGKVLSSYAAMRYPKRTQFHGASYLATISVAS
jgi:hypothetical protein